MEALGKDCSVEESISRFENFFQKMKIEIQIVSYLNPISSVYSVHIRSKNVPSIFTNGKGNSKEASLASAYGEFVERFLTLYFFADYDWGNGEKKWSHHPLEKWVEIQDDFPFEILTPELIQYYKGDDSLRFSELIDKNTFLPNRIGEYTVFVKIS